MSPKKSAPKAAAKSAKPSSKASVKSAPVKKTLAKQASTEKKGAPAAAGAVVTEIDAEEMEAQQDAEEERAAISSGGGGGMAGLEAAKAAGAGDAASVSLKNFRHHPDMENFYRFIFENDLRFEALEILDKLFHEKELKKAAKNAKAKAN